MRSYTPFAVLANLAFSSAAAIPQERDIVSSFLSLLGIDVGVNADSNSETAWFGNDGDYLGEFVNDSGEEIELVIWGPAASWVNENQPLITTNLTHGNSVNVSFATGLSGGFAAIYNTTELSYGQVFNTWGEFTVNGEYSTFDISRLVNMEGRNMSIESSDCTSNMDTCVFTCDSGLSCEFDYELTNCTTGSQKGAEYGLYDGAASGGCLVGSTNYFKTIFG